MLTTALLLLRSSLILSLHLSGNAGSFPKPLNAEEEQSYLERSVQGDLEARNILVERNMRLVAHIIKNGWSERKEDMVLWSKTRSICPFEPAWSFTPVLRRHV